jgi:predicted GNAT family acetyltransferase
MWQADARRIRSVKHLGTIEIGGQETPIILHADQERFEIATPDGPAVLDYELVGNSIALTHTGVPRAMRRQGIGAALAKAALDYARAERLVVRPVCPFVSAFIEAHPEYASLVDPEFPRR